MQAAVRAPQEAAGQAAGGGQETAGERPDPLQAAAQAAELEPDPTWGAAWWAELPATAEELAEQRSRETGESWYDSSSERLSQPLPKSDPGVRARMALVDKCLGGLAPLAKREPVEREPVEGEEAETARRQQLEAQIRELADADRFRVSCRARGDGRGPYREGSMEDRQAHTSLFPPLLERRRAARTFTARSGATSSQQWASSLGRTCSRGSRSSGCWLCSRAASSRRWCRRRQTASLRAGLTRSDWRECSKSWARWAWRRRGRNGQHRAAPAAISQLAVVRGAGDAGVPGAHERRLAHLRVRRVGQGRWGERRREKVCLTLPSQPPTNSPQHLLEVQGADRSARGAGATRDAPPDGGCEQAGGAAVPGHGRAVPECPQQRWGASCRGPGGLGGEGARGLISRVQQCTPTQAAVLLRRILGFRRSYERLGDTKSYPYLEVMDLMITADFRR